MVSKEMKTILMVILMTRCVLGQSLESILLHLLLLEGGVVGPTHPPRLDVDDPGRVRRDHEACFPRCEWRVLGGHHGSDATIVMQRNRRERSRRPW